MWLSLAIVVAGATGTMTAALAYKAREPMRRPCQPRWPTDSWRGSWTLMRTSENDQCCSSFPSALPLACTGPSAVRTIVRILR